MYYTIKYFIDQTVCLGFSIVYVQGCYMVQIYVHSYDMTCWEIRRLRKLVLILGISVVGDFFTIGKWPPLQVVSCAARHLTLRVASGYRGGVFFELTRD